MMDRSQGESLKKAERSCGTLLLRRRTLVLEALPWLDGGAGGDATT